MRVGGEFPSGLIGTVELLLALFTAPAPFRLHVLEGKAGQRTQVAVPLEAFFTLGSLLFFRATAGNDAGVVRLAGRQPRMNDAGAPADGTFRFNRRRFFSGGPCVRTFL